MARCPVFNRKAYARMLEWKRGNGVSALLIEGARRTGKTTLAQAFAAKEYASHLIINFETAPKDVLDIFSQYRHDVGEFFKYLTAYLGVNLKERDSLVVFDEVQRFPMARSFIKQLVADGRYDYMETGSLISIKRNVRDIIIPSEEDKLELGPFDFEEFLEATGDGALVSLIRESFEGLTPLPDALHKKAARRFREYLLVGGMPQAVKAYVEANDFGAADRVKRRILNLYLEDIQKFGGSDASRASAVFNAIPGQLSKHEKRFTLASAGPAARYREYAGALFWLQDSRLVNLCRNVTDPGVGLALTEEDSAFKCYLADTGLLATMAFGDRGEARNELYRNVLFEKLNVNEGMLTENAVAQQLVSSGHRLYYHSSRDDSDARGTMEIDFLVVREYDHAAFKQRVSPIEVKSTKRYGTASLDKFKARYGKRVGYQYVLHPRPLSVVGERICLPLYMAGLL